jgi:hypothetical protein
MRRKHSLTQINRPCRSFTKKDASGIASKSDATRVFLINKSLFFDVCIKYIRTEDSIKRHHDASKVPKLLLPGQTFECLIRTNLLRITSIPFSKSPEIQGSLTMFAA